MIRDDGMIRLADLLAQPELDLTLHHGDPGTALVNVRHAERLADRAWLAPGDLRLSEAPFTLPRPRPDPLFARQPGAIGYALTPQRRNLPDALLTRARERGVALFTIGPTVDLSRVEQATLAGIARHSQTHLQATAAVQRYLLGALDAAKPERELLERAHALCGADLVLLSSWGDVLARAGRRGWRKPDRPPRELPEGRCRLAGRPALLLKIHRSGRLNAVLVAFDTTPESLPVLELTRGLLRVVAAERSAEAERAAAAREALLGEWLAAPADAAALHPRLLQAGLDPESGYAVAVAEVGSRLRGGRRPLRRHALDAAREAVRQAGDEFFAALGIGALSALRADHCLWIFGSAAPTAQLEPLYRALGSATDEAVRVGVGEPSNDPHDVANGYHQALLAAQSIGEAGGARSFTGLDPIYWVLQQQPAANLLALRERLLGPLQQADSSGKLWHTLQCYLRSPGDLGRLADELHIHVNTLRYRLGRIEHLLGRPLSSPETLAQLYLAEQIDALLENA